MKQDMPPAADDAHPTREAQREVDALLAQPTAVVAAAMLAGAGEVDGVTITSRLRERLELELEAATGERGWSREHLRDIRPLFEFLQTQRLITAQRRTVRSRFSSRRPRSPSVRPPQPATGGAPDPDG